MRRLFLTTLAVATLATSAMAQYNSRIQMFAGNFKSQDYTHYSRNGRQPLVNYIGASFEHRIYKNLGLKVQHIRWINSQGPVNDYDLYNDKTTYSNPGTVLSRHDYQALELAQTYTLHMGRHDVYIAAGPSVTWGWGMIAGNLEPDASNMHQPVNVIETPQTKAGIVAELGYNARILGPMSIGVAGTYRHYEFFNYYSAQLNIGYNFNSINLHK